MGRTTQREGIKELAYVGSTFTEEHLIKKIVDAVRIEVREEVNAEMRRTFKELQKNTTELPNLVSRTEAAGILQCTKRTLRNYELRGELQPHRVGRRTTYKISDINRLINPKK